MIMAIIDFYVPNNPWQGTSLRQTVAKCDQCIIKAATKGVELDKKISNNEKKLFWRWQWRAGIF